MRIIHANCGAFISSFVILIFSYCFLIAKWYLTIGETVVGVQELCAADHMRIIIIARAQIYVTSIIFSYQDIILLTCLSYDLAKQTDC